jgi:ribosome recycling factor
MQNTQFTPIITHLEEELRGIRTNRANPSMVESITVMAYGSPMKLLEVASISTPEPQQIVIQPWDKSLLQVIESAIAADPKLQASPAVDGEIIRISLPPLTEDRRKDLVKLMGTITEQARIQVRKIREQLLKDAKTKEKAGDMSEDDYFRIEKDIQTQVDEANAAIEAHAAAKEKELMTV